MKTPKQELEPIDAAAAQMGNSALAGGEVVGVDLPAREVLLPRERIPFDYLILATGAQHSYFGRNE